MITTVAKPRVHVVILGLLLHLRPNYFHSASNDIHTDGPRARARARYSENLLIFFNSAYFVTLKRRSNRF